MSSQLSLWSLFTHASILVQCIMLLLVGLSVTSWAMIIQYRRILASSEQDAAAFQEEFWSVRDLKVLYDKTAPKRKVSGGLAAVFAAAMRDYQRFQDDKLPKTMAAEHMERAMTVAMMREREYLQNNMNFLATIGSVSPYIGLFGTVWGIMHAFIALGGVQQATISMVAPGIAEALIATAIGLFAAIPAVVAYNRFSSRVSVLMNRYSIFSDEVLGVLLKKLMQQA